MALRIDWDNHEVVEAEDYEPWELSDTIEDVREAMDHLVESMKSIPESLEDLLVALVELEEEYNGTDQD